jgi:hypothetical protein
MFLVFEILRSAALRSTTGATPASKKKKLRAALSPSPERDVDPADDEWKGEEAEEEYSDENTRGKGKRRPAYELEDDDFFGEVGGERNGEEFSSADDDMDPDGDQFAGAITDEWHEPGSGWNPKEKNAKSSSMWGKYSTFVTSLIRTHCDVTMEVPTNRAGIATIMRIVQNHPSFSKLGGTNCHRDCPQELATYTRNMCLEGGLHDTILDRMRNYRRAIRNKDALQRKRKAKKIGKKLEKARKRDSTFKMSDKDKKFMTSYNTETHRAETARQVKKDKSADKIYQAQRRVQIDKVISSHIAQTHMSDVYATCNDDTSFQCKPNRTIACVGQAAEEFKQEGGRRG